MTNLIKTIQSGDAQQAQVRKRFETGRIITVEGGEVELDVGYYHPDGSAETLQLPYASSFTPVVGQTASIIYPNDDPNAAYVVAAAESAQYNPIVPDPTPTPMTVAYPITLEIRTNAGHASYSKLASTLNKSGGTLTVLGVTFSSANGGAGDYADCRIGGTSILTSGVNLPDDGGKNVVGTLNGTPTIAVNAEIQLYFKGNSDKDICMVLWVSVTVS